MFAGHFGLAAAAAATKKAPVWALMVSTQLLDIVFVPLLLGGVERIDSSEGSGYGEGVIHADYTHSLIGALLLAFAAAAFAKRRWGTNGGWLIFGMTFSHWLLDLLVHRADMPLLPGHLDGLPLMGFGLWQSPYASLAAESLLILAGLILYGRSAFRRSSVNGTAARAGWSTLAMGVCLIAALASDWLGV
jgi:membrane-bound metal-dependent hydrolase YbcI (DUF457 family)